MISVWKYGLSGYIGATQTVEMQKGALILTVQRQGSGINLWAKIDDSMPTETRNFIVIGTGFDIPALAAGSEYVYIGTVQVSQLVWHVFEIVAGS